MFETTSFIKPDIPFDPASKATAVAPIFRGRFTLRETVPARLSWCALGMGRVYINGRRIDDRVFGTDESAYHKTLWYNSMDVSEFLREGENSIAVLCGCGFFNEVFKSSWNFDQARWRDFPKLICELTAGERLLLRTDESWKYTLDTPITYNQTRAGEHFDARKYDPAVCSAEFDDSDWRNAKLDDTPPSGVFRESFIPPVRECAELEAVKIYDFGDRAVYDFGVNLSGYPHLRVKQPSGRAITIRCGEDFEGGVVGGPQSKQHYPDCEIFCDRFICSGRDDDWKPSFSYNGFRYLEVVGLISPSKDALRAVFIHQDVARTGFFSCSDRKLERLFDIGVQACYSNFVSKPTDCPTREKLGWANDLQASTEQMLINFDVADYFRKFLRDTADCMRDDGELPGIIPTDVWGYDWGNGPVSEGVLFEQCLQIYRYTGDGSAMVEYLPYMLRSLEYFKSREDESGFTAYGLTDWAPPYPSVIPVQFINGALVCHLTDIARLAAELSGDAECERKLVSRRSELRERFMKAYLREDGSCVYDSMTAPAMAIAFRLYDSLEPLKKQLIADIERCGCHHNCGMVGLRRLYDALDICGRPDLAFKIITSEGYPSYYRWLDRGATTLWETWGCESSHNHHMYSSFMGWLMTSLCGIRVDDAHPGYERVLLRPYFERSLVRCEGSVETKKGRITSGWTRENGNVAYRFIIPDGVSALYGGVEYGAGEHTVMLREL